MMPVPITLEEGKDKHIYISIWLHGRNWVPAGAITYNEALGYSGFSYFESYIQAQHPPLNPATLNYRDTNNRHFIVDARTNTQMLDRTFWELLPNTGDFGHQALISRLPQYQSLNHVQKLHLLGQRIVGGMASYVKKMQDEVSVEGTDWLEAVRREAVGFHMKELSRIKLNSESLIAMTSYGGVRPKAMFKDSEGRHWIAKFNLPTDPYDMALAEHVAMRMTAAAGLECPETKVIQLVSGDNVFLTERFDRRGKVRLHSLSMFSLVPGIEIASGGRRIGPKPNTAGVMATILRRFSDFKDIDTARIITKFLMDVALNNTDNHLRNTRMILNKEGLWELSPAFDILFNPRSQPHIYNPAGLDLSETYLQNDALITGLAHQAGVDAEQVEQLRNTVIGVAEKWEDFCDESGMSREDKSKIHAAISLGMSRAEVAHKIQRDHRAKIEMALAKPRLNSF